MRRFNQDGKSSRRDSNRSSDSEPRRFSRKDSNRSSDTEPRGFSRRDSGRSDDSEPRRFSRRDSGRRPLEMHKVTCDKCGQSCEVPFRPTHGKPVYCSNCFRKGGNDESRRPPQHSYGASENPESDKPVKYQHEFDQINEKLNKLLKLLEID
jgi:CxxC-x17-CxxC domain-containing protein